MQQSNFTRQDDEQLLAIVACQRKVSFRKISQIMHKPELKCHRRYLQLTKQVDKDDPDAFVWTKKDDEILRQHVSVHGTKHWKLATKSLPKWLGWECRRRFNEYIKTNRESWTQEEDQHLLRLYEVYGSRWTQIAKHLENNRSYELVKRRYGQLLYNLNKRSHTSLETGKIS